MGFKISDAIRVWQIRGNISHTKNKRNVTQKLTIAQENCCSIEQSARGWCWWVFGKQSVGICHVRGFPWLFTVANQYPALVPPILLYRNTCLRVTILAEQMRCLYISNTSAQLSIANTSTNTNASTALSILPILQDKTLGIFLLLMTRIFKLISCFPSGHWILGYSLLSGFLVRY